MVDDEGIVYADIDLNKCIQPKQMHDIIGHYNRFDVFDLRVNRTGQSPVTLIDAPALAAIPVSPRSSPEDEGQPSSSL